MTHKYLLFKNTNLVHRTGRNLVNKELKKKILNVNKGLQNNKRVLPKWGGR